MSQNNESPDAQSDAEFLRMAVSELNQSIAYLSKMVLQLQRSISAQKPNQNKSNANSKKEKPATIH